MKQIIILIVVAIFAFGCKETKENKETKVVEKSGNPIVAMETTMGTIEIELDAKNAPITVENFLNYVNSDFYNGTIFHRVIDNFMIQGGGFTPDGAQKETNASIKLESQNGLANKFGTIAMARTNVPNSATCQFFINVKDNDFLNWSPTNPGYAVFGKVVSGMDVVDGITSVATGVKNRMQDWPIENIIIEKAYLKD